jgi:hypothetical protein
MEEARLPDEFISLKYYCFGRGHEEITFLVNRSVDYTVSA